MTVRRLMRTSVRWALALAGAYLLLLLDWRSAGAPLRPVVRHAFQAAAPLDAGAARLALAPPLPVVRAGYRPPRAVADHERDPLEVRALVLRAQGRTLALVLADLVLVPDELARALESRLSDLHLDGLLMAATHTHSSVGGFDARLLAQAVGTGRYRRDVVAAILERSERVVRQAHERLAPATLRTAETRLAGWAQNRSSPGAPVDDALTVVRVDGAGGLVATVAVVSAHATLLPRTSPELSAEYPGAAMRRIESSGGVALLLQGAEGDARPPGSGEAAVEAAGAFVAREVAESSRSALPAAAQLGFAEVEVGLPPAEPQAIRSFLLRRPAANLLQWLAPRNTRVAVVVLGDLTMLAVPGEPTAAAAQRLVAMLPREPLQGRKVRVVGLAGGYVGYINTPESARAASGEGRRAWFAPELIDSIGHGLQVGLGALTPSSPPLGYK